MNSFMDTSLAGAQIDEPQMPYWTRALPLAVAVFFAALCFSTRTLTVSTYNWIIATPVVLILLLYCVPVIAGYG